MLGPRSIPSTALRAAARSSRITQNPSTTHSSVPNVISRQTRCFRTTPLRREERPSFKGQLYESTKQRVDRERAEIDRFARMQKESPMLRNIAMTICTLLCLMDLQSCDLVVVDRPNCLRGLLTRPIPLQHSPSPHWVATILVPLGLRNYPIPRRHISLTPALPVMILLLETSKLHGQTLSKS